jgi:hypothetical protein
MNNLFNLIIYIKTMTNLTLLISDKNITFLDSYDWILYLVSYLWNDITTDYLISTLKNINYDKTIKGAMFLFTTGFDYIIRPVYETQ